MYSKPTPFARTCSHNSYPETLCCYQQIRAEQIVSNVEGLNELRTFGWSLSSAVDVDNNQYEGKEWRVGNGREDQDIQERMEGGGWELQEGIIRENEK